MNKKFLYLLIVVAAGLAVWVVYAGVKTYQLGGAVTSVEGNYATVYGFLDLAKQEETDFLSNEAYDTRVRLSSGTKIRRIAIQIPSTENEVYNIDDLPQEESEVGIDEFRQEVQGAQDVIGFVAEVKRDWLNPFVFRTSEVEYRVPIFEVRRLDFYGN